MHRILAKQIARSLTDEQAINLDELIRLVDITYDQFDKDRARSERASQLMVTELEEISSAREAMLESVKVKNQTLDAALENMAHGLAMFNVDGSLAVCNSLYQIMFALEECGPRKIAGNQEELLAGGEINAMSIEDIRASMQLGRPVEQTSILADGRTIASTFQPLAQGGWVEVHRDITEQRRADDRIRFLARHDALTGLVNRVVLNEAIETECARVRRGTSLAILCLDLDRFKQVNDTLGHPIGDKLLQGVADRLKRTVRATDTIARLGGDEFAIVQVLAEQPAGAGQLAERIIETIGQPFEIAGHQIMIGASVGISIAPVDGLDAETLLRNADLALYRAKSDGRGTYRYFEAGMDQAAQARRLLELDLRRAILLNEFDLHYQPLLNLDTNSITSCEALIRWRHPKHGLVPPDRFIPLAEEIGLIVDIGNWVLQKACQEACQWPSHVGLAVNISPAQFKSDGLVQSVSNALARSGLPAERLELEITETVLLSDTDKTLAILARLKGIGVRISMDDFGTGYSSLSYLRKFAFDKLKIDRSFISDIGNGPDGRSIVKAVTELASSLGMMTTAEGVEFAEQRDYLESLRCSEIQGYLISRPLPPQEMIKMLWDRKQVAVAAA